MSEIEDVATNLADISNNLYHNWIESEVGWQDEVRVQFENQHWIDFQNGLRNIVNNFQHLSEQMTLAAQYVEDQMNIAENLKLELNGQNHDPYLNPEC